ncbi:MAG: ribbon-helix-helix protein, CopG family [Gemmatimonadetes bacterium]|nr:ribbon-helix-helix protein, CopG family [Gemmatimonadota bacterium]
MNTTLTVRTDRTMREALEERAQAQGLTVSELVRRLLEEAISERPLAQRVGHLKGRLELSDPGGDAWRNRLRERNWRT